MKVLVLCGEIPYPPHGGSRMRVYQLIRSLVKRHQITLLAYQYSEDECAGVRALQALCQVDVVPWIEPETLRQLREKSGVAAWLAYARSLWLDSAPFVAQYFHSSAFKTRVQEWLARERFDLVHVEDTAMMLLLPPKLRLPIVLSIQNVETWRATRADATDLGQRVDEWKLRRYEAHAFARASVCCPTSQLEAEQVKQLTPNARVRIVANGVDTEEFTPSVAPASQIPILVFTGTLSYEPNAEGIQWFARSVWPLIIKAIPDTRLLIVGREPPADVPALASDTIEVCGDVPDVRPYLQGAWVAIAPILHGGGTRLKILEAMACALPLVATTIGAEGLDVVSGRELLIADAPLPFAEQTVRLLREPMLRATLGQAGRILVEKHYDWRAIGIALEEAYQEALCVRAR